jgi:hypothetical protein
MRELIKVMKALRNDNRVRIVKMLQDGGLWVYYRVADGGKSPYAAAMLGYLKHWFDNTVENAEMRKRIHQIRQRDLCKTLSATDEAKPVDARTFLRAGRRGRDSGKGAIVGRGEG